METISLIWCIISIYIEQIIYNYIVQIFSII